MKITLRLILSLIVAVAAVAIGSAYLQVNSERKQLQSELEGRSRLLALELKDAVTPILAAQGPAHLEGLVGNLGLQEKLYGLALYDSKGNQLGMTPGLSRLLSSTPRAVTESLTKRVEAWQFDQPNSGRFHVYAMPILKEGAPTGAIVVVHDAAYVRQQLSRIWFLTFERVIVQMLLISLVTLIVVRWSITGPASRLALWMRRVRSGTFDESMAAPKAGLFEPIAVEAKTMARHLSAAKSAAEMEARLRQARESVWTPERLKESVKIMLKGRPLFVVSNREPYMHVHRERKTELVVPPGGLVTALEPVLRAAGGTWIAHGSGDADFEVVDERNRIRVPPDDPLYTLKRVALTRKEEQGYYYGFANEGLWPLCHIAHTRPTFRTDDWSEYKHVNQKFAWTALEEMEDVDDPCILIQDYHFALLPRLIKDKRPDARIAIFWHIPWPNPEAIAICPWQKEILGGMIGADLVGFQTQYFCNNFLDTVDRTLEARIDWERFAVRKEGMTTLVKPFPISVAFPGPFLDVFAGGGNGRGKEAILKELGVSGRYLGVGVERMDYTKGVLERFRAIERFLEQHEAFIGEFVFVQLGAPSRTQIKRYQEFLAEIDREVDRINGRFKSRDWKPIIYLKRAHSHKEILPFYKSADLCMVTSLHDGMNLVAKEFVAEREDDDGVLILSRFTGAARELRDALIVNPYDIDQMAEAIRHALLMSPEERAVRMHRMREAVRVHNVYRWAGTLIEELVNIQVGGRPAAQK